MKTTILAMAIVILASTQVDAQVYGHELFYENLNAYRKKHFLRQLKVDTTLEKESLEQVKKIITKWKGVLVHGSVNGGDNKFKGEVLAKNTDLAWWLTSPGHRKIVLSRKARKVGFANIGNIYCARLSD